MRAHTRSRPALVAVAAAIAVACAACGSTSANSASGGSGPAGPDSIGSGPASSATSGFPVTVTTAGGTVHLTSQPHAIVSLSPTATEMLYAIGAGSEVKAVDSLSDYPKQAPVTKLSAYEPNAEAIASYQPDLVIISNDMNKITAKLTALSIPVLDLPAAVNMSGVYHELTELGQATGHLAQATAENSKLKAKVASIVASLPKHRKPVTYYYELSTNPYYSVTSSTFIGSVLSLLGMKNIADAAKGAAAAGGYPTLSAEFILKANPEYILLADTGADGSQTAATVSKRPGWSVVTAVQDKHIIALNADIASRWGPRIVQLLKTVAAAIKSGSQ